MRITKKQAKRIGDKLGMDWDTYNLREFTQGMNTELEHRAVTKGDFTLTGMIARDHLDEVPDYYTKLEKYVELGVS